jgi:hypothetical protein
VRVVLEASSKSIPNGRGDGNGLGPLVGDGVRPRARFNGLVALTGRLIGLIVINSSESSGGGLGVRFRTCKAPRGGEVLETAEIRTSAVIRETYSIRRKLVSPVRAMPPISDTSSALITCIIWVVDIELIFARSSRAFRSASESPPISFKANKPEERSNS